jgi:hypothetical protein
MTFLSELNRAQQYIRHLIENGEMEELCAFNGYLGPTLDQWCQLALPPAIHSRIAAIRPLEVEKQKQKHFWWSLVAWFGFYMSEEMAKDDLKNQLRTVRGQLASIEFLYKETF